MSRQEKIIEKVYPRVCGGTVMPPILALDVTDGSIPACAGEPRIIRGEYRKKANRSIPACAGEPCNKMRK